MPKVSVLVAVYNAEKTLSRCLDSLLSQSIGEVQIICIDDASTDSSLTILRQYAATHSCIEVVALDTNHGQAYARNQGIPLIKSPLTAYLDSDDYMSADALEQAFHVFDTHHDTDCVLLDVRYVYDDGREHGYHAPPFDIMTGQEAFVKSLRWDIHGIYVARTELYRRFPFDESCRSYSDDNVTMAHYLHSREVRCCTGRYFFVQHEDSCTHQPTVTRFDWLLANMSMHRQLLQWNMPLDIINIYEEQRWYVLLNCFWFYHRNKHIFSSKERTHALHILHKAWQDIDTSSCLPTSIRWKPGYMPIKWSWTVFQLQEWMLYLIRKLRGMEDGRNNL